MVASETSILISGQKVGLAVAPYQADLLDEFIPLKDANAERAVLVKAIEIKEGIQDEGTAHTTTAKDAAREAMAVATDILSARAVGYALATGQTGLKQEYTLTYADVRYGEATEDVNHVRALVQKVGDLPEDVRLLYRLTDAIIKAPAAAATLFDKADDVQTEAKAAPHLATLLLPDLLRRLSAVLLLMKKLIYGQHQDPDPRWAALNTAFGTANKRTKVAPKHHLRPAATRIVRTIPITLHDGLARQYANTNYDPAYTLTVTNRSAGPLRLWMAQKGGAPTTPGLCPAGETTTLTRADIGPETARYLMAQFEGDEGGQATVVVRKVVVPA